MLVYVVTAAAGLIPGGLLGFALPPGRERWVVWATAPILTLGLVAAAMVWLPAAGLPSAAQWVLTAELVLAVLIPAASWLAARWRPVAGGQPGPAAGWRHWVLGTGPRPSRADLIGAAIPVAVAVTFGRLFLGSLSKLPGWDAMDYAVLTRNIIQAGSTAIPAVCTTGHPLPKVACHFYPLAGDVSWAQVAVLTGGHISTAMLAWSVLIGPAALTMAVYAAVRVLGGGPLAAASAAIAPVFLSHLWPSLASGRPSEAFAPGMSVSVALLVTLAVRGKYPVRLGLLAGLGLAGLVMLHTYDVLFAGTLALAFVATDRVRGSLRAALTAGGAIAAGTLAICGPLTAALLGTRTERAPARIVDLVSLAQAWRFWVTSPAGYSVLVPSPLHVLAVRAALWLALPCLLAAPLSFVLAELRWARPWLIALVVWTALGIWTSVSSSPAAEYLASLWYSEMGRLRTMASPLHGVLAVAGAYAIGLCLYRLALKVTHRARDLRLETLAAGGAAALLAVALIGLTAVPGTYSPMLRSYRHRTPVGAAYPRVFAWLASHTRPGMVVAYNRHEDFMTWSYADYGVAGLFGTPALVPSSRQDYHDRWLAWLWLSGKPGTPAGGCLVRRYHIEYVVIGRQHLPEPRHFYDAKLVNYSRPRLAASPDLLLVHHDHGIEVYRVTRAGTACRGQAGVPSAAHT